MNKELPTVKLSGRDGNAFAIMGACQKAARQAGWSAEKIKDADLDALRAAVEALGPVVKR